MSILTPRFLRVQMNHNESYSGKKTLSVRRALDSDAPAIHSLMSEYASKGLLLPVSESDLRDIIDTFLVVEERTGTVVGCVALRDFGENLYEVRSLAVKPSMNGKGVGSDLVANLPKLFEMPAGSTLFALTYSPSFFRRLGFENVDKSLFPKKIWSDCENCPKKDHCDEQAVSATIPLPTQPRLTRREAI